MALLPSVTQIPAQRVSVTEPPQAAFVSREWYRFFDSLHTYVPTPAVFTPAFTPGGNVTSIASASAFYNQMGTVVSLTGSFTLTPAGAGDTSFSLTPPVLDNLSVGLAAGLFTTTASGFSEVGSVTAAANTLLFRVNIVNTAAATYVFNVNYQIV